MEAVVNHEILSPSHRNAPAPDESRILRSTAAIQAMGKTSMRPAMNSRNTHHPPPPGPDPELATQESSGALVWLTFHAVALWSAASHWLKFKRMCAWHEPKPRRMGGNPLARRTTHGMCPECFAPVSGEIISHGETGLRVGIAEHRHAGGPSLPAPPARNCAVPARLQRPSAGDPDTPRSAILRGKTSPRIINPQIRPGS